MKFFLITLLFFVNISAIEPIKSDFKSCYLKYRNSFIRIGNETGIAVLKKRVLLFSRKKLSGYIKYDPFLGLYLFKTNKNVKAVKFLPFKDIKTSQKIAVISKNGYDINEMASKGDSFLNSNFLQHSAKAGSLVTTVCCRLYGITTGEKHFIDSDYINKFLNSVSVTYGDLGIEAEKYKDKIIVKAVNPFFKDLRVKCGDEIVSIDGKRFNDIKSFRKYILFLKPGKVVKLKLKRGGEVFTRKIKVIKYLENESALYSAGLKIDRKLKVVGVKDGSLFDRLGIKTGDKLMKINKKYVKSYYDMEKVLSCLKRGVTYMLFSRDDFQFFIHFRR